MHIRIISVGNKPRPELQTLITTYESRLPRSIRVDWSLIKHGSGDAQSSMNQEAEKILKAIPNGYRSVLLDEKGKNIKSEEFSLNFIEPQQDICFIIGGAYGVSEEVRNRADFIMSLSQLVMPHQLVRLVLIEQIYRGYCIATRHPYHHA